MWEVRCAGEMRGRSREMRRVGDRGRRVEMRTWPDWNAPWTVPLYNAEVCSPAKKSLPPTLPPKALVMVAFPFGVPATLGAAQRRVGRTALRRRWLCRRTDFDKRVRALCKRIGAPIRADNLRRSRRDRDITRHDLDQIRPDLRERCGGDAREIVRGALVAPAGDAREICGRGKGDHTCVQTAASLICSAVSADAPSANVMSTGLADSSCTLRK